MTPVRKLWAFCVKVLTINYQKVERQVSEEEHDTQLVKVSKSASSKGAGVRLIEMRSSI